KAKGLDFSPIFKRPAVGPEVAIRRIRPQDHGLQTALDYQLLKKVQGPSRPENRWWSSRRSPTAIAPPVRSSAAKYRSSTATTACPKIRSRSSSRVPPARALAPSCLAA